jgi:hypothetical protein
MTIAPRLQAPLELAAGLGLLFLSVGLCMLWGERSAPPHPALAAEVVDSARRTHVLPTPGSPTSETDARWASASMSSSTSAVFEDGSHKPIRRPSHRWAPSCPAARGEGFGR